MDRFGKDSYKAARITLAVLLVWALPDHARLALAAPSNDATHSLAIELERSHSEPVRPAPAPADSLGRSTADDADTLTIAESSDDERGTSEGDSPSLGAAATDGPTAEDGGARVEDAAQGREMLAPVWPHEVEWPAAVLLDDGDVVAASGDDAAVLLTSSGSGVASLRFVPGWGGDTLAPVTARHTDRIVHREPTLVSGFTGRDAPLATTIGVFDPERTDTRFELSYTPTEALAPAVVAPATLSPFVAAPGPGPGSGTLDLHIATSALSDKLTARAGYRGIRPGVAPGTLMPRADFEIAYRLLKTSYEIADNLLRLTATARHRQLDLRTSDGSTAGNGLRLSNELTVEGKLGAFDLEAKQAWSDDTGRPGPTDQSRARVATADLSMPLRPVGTVLSGAAGSVDATLHYNLNRVRTETFRSDGGSSDAANQGYSSDKVGIDLAAQRWRLTYWVSKSLESKAQAGANPTLAGFVGHDLKIDLRTFAPMDVSFGLSAGRGDREKSGTSAFGQSMAVYWPLRRHSWLALGYSRSMSHDPNSGVSEQHTKVEAKLGVPLERIATGLQRFGGKLVLSNGFDVASHHDTPTDRTTAGQDWSLRADVEIPFL